MNCIAIDDEPLALSVIKNFCVKIDYINLVGVCTNAIDAVQLLNSHQIDLIFLDIHMPHVSGLKFVQTLKNPPMIIFTTAYSEHALASYELDAIDYLVKPIPFDRFLKASNKAYELFKLKSNTEQATPANKIQESFLMVKVDYSTVRVDLDDILYIEGVKDYVKIVLNERSLLTKTTMIKLEERLPQGEFIRVHKSFIVSVSKIEKVENNRIVFDNTRIPVGEHYKEEFNKIIDKYKL